MSNTRRTKKKPGQEEQVTKSLDIVADGLQSSKHKIDEALGKTYELLKNC